MQEKLEKILLDNDSEDETPKLIYAILDASGNKEVYKKSLFNDEQFTALFDKAELEKVSPYLVVLRKGDELTNWILKNYKEANWISFIQSDKPYELVLQTLKSFTKTYDEEEDHYVFIRYWDPRAIEICLDMFGEEGRAEWFNVIDSMYARDTLEDDRLVKFTHQGRIYLDLEEGCAVC